MIDRVDRDLFPCPGNGRVKEPSGEHVRCAVRKYDMDRIKAGPLAFMRRDRICKGKIMKVPSSDRKGPVSDLYLYAALLFPDTDQFSNVSIPVPGVIIRGGEDHFVTRTVIG